jgi:hypothetical protein
MFVEIRDAKTLFWNYMTAKGPFTTICRKWHVFLRDNETKPTSLVNYYNKRFHKQIKNYKRYIRLRKKRSDISVKVWEYRCFNLLRNSIKRVIWWFYLFEWEKFFLLTNNSKGNIERAKEFYLRNKCTVENYFNLILNIFTLLSLQIVVHFCFGTRDVDVMIYSYINQIFLMFD